MYYFNAFICLLFINYRRKRRERYFRVWLNLCLLYINKLNFNRMHRERDNLVSFFFVFIMYFYYNLCFFRNYLIFLIVIIFFKEGVLSF